MKINKIFRFSLISIMGVLMGIFLFLLFNHIKNPGVNEEKLTLYKYNHQSNLNYQVFLKPNILYEKQSMGEDQVYITEFINTIKTKFNYEFTGEREADISGDYEIVAQVEGYIDDNGEIKTIWKKNYIALPKKDFNVKEKNFSINEEIELKLNQYNEFVEKIKKDYGVNTLTKLTLLINIDLTVNTDKGIISENISPSIIMPLDVKYFNIIKNLEEEKEGALEETIEGKLPINKNIIILYGSIIGILILAVLYVLIFTKNAAKPSTQEIEVKKIFKNHGPRLVALSSDVARGWKKYHKVYSIDDLVKVADELEKPIMYKYSSDMAEINFFYVFDDSFIYVFDLSEKVNGSKNDQFKNLNYLENSLENGDSSSSTF